MLAHSLNAHDLVQATLKLAAWNPVSFPCQAERSSHLGSHLLPGRNLELDKEPECKPRHSDTPSGHPKWRFTHGTKYLTQQFCSDTFCPTKACTIHTHSTNFTFLLVLQIYEIL